MFLLLEIRIHQLSHSPSRLSLFLYHASLLSILSDFCEAFKCTYFVASSPLYICVWMLLVSVRIMSLYELGLGLVTVGARVVPSSIFWSCGNIMKLILEGWQRRERGASSKQVQDVHIVGSCHGSCTSCVYCGLVRRVGRFSWSRGAQ